MSERGIAGDYNVNKGGTAYMTPFADESRQRAFFIKKKGKDKNNGKRNNC
ncbi:MAG: hypothetical protein IJB84_07085 [Lachnospiraceae bacterium]|nr:hypothetical protein [Lachnospiraceae bacterium]